MFLGHNASWWGVAISISALILTLPLTVLGNILTPMLAKLALRWTDKSLDKRIANLEGQLKTLDDNCPLLSPTEEQIIKAALCNAKLLSFTMNILGIAAFLVAFNSPLATDVRVVFGAMGMGLYFLPWAWRRDTVNDLGKYLKDHSPKRRAAYRKMLETYQGIRNRVR